MNRPPIANAGRDLRVLRSAELVYVELDGLSSHDPDGDSIEWRWSVVRAPAGGATIGATAVRAPRPVVPLEGDGLYVFSLEVRDREAASTPDYVNVWVGRGDPPREPRPGPDDGGADDAGAPDARLADAGDVGVVPDEGAGDGSSPDAPAPPPDAAPMVDLSVADEAVEPDGPPPPPVGPNRAPRPVIDAPADRVDVGQPLRLSAARSRDDGRPGPLSFTWRLVRAPFGGRASFTSRGVGVEYMPRRAGRYTFELEADDGELRASVRRSVFARGSLAYVLFPEDGAARAFDTDDGRPIGAPIPLGPLDAVAGFVARAGVLYVTAHHRGDALLVVAEPGRPTLRRLLAEDARATSPAAGLDGVWVPLHGTPALLFSDPIGARPMVTLRLPQRLDRAFALAVRGERAWVSSTDPPSRVTELDLAAGGARRDLLRGSDACGLLHTVAADEEYVYVGCRQRNAVARARWGHSGEVRRGDVIDLPGGAAPRNLRVVLTDEHVVVRHRLTDFVSVVPTSRWSLPPEHADRGRAAQRVVRVEDAVVDVAGRGRSFFALVNDAQGRVRVHAFEARTGRRLWRRGLSGRRATHLAVDVADDFSTDLGEL